MKKTVSAYKYNKLKKAAEVGLLSIEAFQQMRRTELIDDDFPTRRDFADVLGRQAVKILHEVGIGVRKRKNVRPRILRNL